MGPRRENRKNQGTLLVIHKKEFLKEKKGKKS